MKCWKDIAGFRLSRVAIAIISILTGGSQGHAAAALLSDEPVMETRIPWTTSRISGSPEPPSPYRVEPVFPNLKKFVEPLELVAVPASDRLLIVEHESKIFSVPNDPNCKSADLFADMKQLNPEVKEVYSVAFPPQFATNHLVYIWYILKPELPEGTHISRFKVTETNPPRVDLSSEELVFTWKSGGHNGGCMRFGLDGYLYIGTGDGAGPDPPDSLNTGQDISDVLSSILRIDVEQTGNGKPYRIPPDNPFINTPGARPEVWAYGLRNPWRMSIDRKTGDLWVGDVGWELWEMIYRVQRGGNYGWSILEGSHQPVKPEGKHGPTPILPPTLEHPHSEAASITGGCVYRGKRIPELVGSYIYGDWETRKIWELRHDGSRVTKKRELVTTPYRIVSFGEDNDGELYIVDFGGTIQRLVPNPALGSRSPFPRKLSETGLFDSVAAQKPAPGVLPYSINAELWSDYAQAERFAAFPGTSTVVSNDGRWQFPTNAVLAKTLSLEMERGNPASRRKVESQLLHFTGEGWNAYSFQWNTEQTEATLLAAEGAEQAFTIIDAAAPGGKRHQTWRFHSRSECLRCHNPWCNTALGFNLPQLNRIAADPVNRPARGTNMNQLQRFERLGLIHPSGIGSNLALKLVNPYDRAASVNTRARSYLHVNCSHCHREHAGGSVVSYMNFDVPLDKAALLGQRPVQGSLSIENAQVIAAGDPFHSVLFYRMSKLGKGHMPYLGSSWLDEPGVSLICDWIQGLPSSNEGEGHPANASAQHPGDESALKRLRSGESLPGQQQSALIDKMLSSVSDALALLRAVDEKSFSPAVRDTIIAKGTAASEPLVRDLFERFLPDEKRTKVLGTNIKPEAILALTGDAGRGRKLFTREGAAQCQTCHRTEGVGRDFGPDLSHIGQKYSRAQLLENILEPSKVIDPKFIPYLVETKDEAVHSGFVLARAATEVVLKETTGEVRLSTAAITRMEAQRLSLMPEGLLQGMTAQEAADLIEYLASLR